MTTLSPPPQMAELRRYSTVPTVGSLTGFPPDSEKDGPLIAAKEEYVKRSKLGHCCVGSS